MFSLGSREPQEDEVVVYTVRSIHHKEAFARVELCDYGAMEAMLPFTHLSRKRSTKSVRKYLTVGKKDVGAVLSLAYGSDGSCHPAISRKAVEEEERVKELEALGQRLRLLKWASFLRQSFFSSNKEPESADADPSAKKMTSQELYDTFIGPLFAVDGTPDPWDVLRDFPAAKLFEEQGPWHHLASLWGIPPWLPLIEKASQKMFPKPPVKVTLKIEARGESVDKLKEWAHTIDALPEADLALTIVSPPHYCLTKPNVDQDEVAKVKDDLAALLLRPFEGVTVKLTE
jgi:translation initiation factor 2 alpha subunit (eIF-2alpha)